MSMISFEGFRAFAATQTGFYNYDETGACAFACYLRELGKEKPDVLMTTFSFAELVEIVPKPETGSMFTSKRIRMEFSELHPGLAEALYPGDWEAYGNDTETKDPDMLVDWTVLSAKLDALVAEAA